MKISYNWLKEYIDFDYSPEELRDVLTMTGLEVGSVETVGGPAHSLDGVVVGKVLSVTPHPNADRLRVCQVDVGGEAPLNIVCGAPNVAEGQYVPVATIGAELLPFGEEKSFKIKKGKIRGELSEGMICAEDELGLGAGHEGIMVLPEGSPVGAPFADTLKSDQDFVLEIDLTPNRVDAASHYGVARDLAALLRKPARLPERMLDPAGLTMPHPIPVKVADPERCRRYTSIYIEGVTVKESPDWLKDRLVSIGLRPINNIVDITNYVLHELGHPMHAFDADQLRGRQVIVRTMAEDTPFVTLDEKTRTLQAGQDLMICDAERPLCIGGIMGGLNSGVTEQTKNVFLESAYFDPGTVRRSAKRLGLSTDSSFRFERGADPNMTLNAALRAAALIVDLAGGTASEVSDVKAQADFPPHPITLSVRNAHRLIGKAIPKAEIMEILRALEMEVQEAADGDTLQLLVPAYRVDVEREVDVLEDLLRIYGYNSVEIPTQLRGTLSFRPHGSRFQLRERYANALSANGFYEILTNSLVSVSQGDDKAVPILNPLSEELGIMRRSMLPGALEVVRYNQNRQQSTLAFYEFGKTYQMDGPGAYDEQEWLGITVAGTRHPMHWAEKAPVVSIGTLTREVERLQRWMGLKGSLREAEHPEFDYGMEWIVAGRSLLRYGRVKQETLEAWGIRLEVFHLVVDWPALADLAGQTSPTFQEVPLYPSIRRDLSLLLDRGQTFAEVQQVVAKANPKLIRSVSLHDVFQGEGIPEGKKSYLVSIELRDDRKTLEDNVADKVMKGVHHQLQRQLGVSIR